jgi:predicted TIM-barrel fold metal-dependent hydrolase
MGGKRRWVWAALGVAAVGAVLAIAYWPPPGPTGPTPEPPTEAERFLDVPRIDVHTHIGLEQADQALAIMDAEGIAIALNASGGAPGSGLERSIEIAERTHGRLRPYCNIGLRGVEEPDFAESVVAHLEACKEAGAVGLKLFKSLGLGITLADGSLLAVDDPRLDIMFATAGRLGLPVLIHSGDPQAFFRPPTPENERYAELRVHPAWSFHGERPDGVPWPSWETVFAQFERRVARHPETTFVGAHFGNAPEEPRRVGRMLERYPNLVVETGARIPEIGRHDPDEMHRLFVRHADRILFGTDLAVTSDGLTLGSRGEDPDPPDRVPAFFASHFRYFETRARGFAHPTPIQGDWTIDGIGLPREVLEKLYYRNALRVFGLTLPTE